MLIVMVRPALSSGPAAASKVELRFTALDAERTRVELVQSEWERFGEFAEMMMNGYPKGWIEIFDRAYRGACTVKESVRTGGQVS